MPLYLRGNGIRMNFNNTVSGESTIENYRPWGFYEVLIEEPCYKVKRIKVLPEKRLSLQLHKYRSEHWFFIQGEALVQLNEKQIVMKKGASIDIPQGTWHRVRNQCEGEVIFIEIQIGDYFGEDDIERKEDDYGRSDRI